MKTALALCGMSGNTVENDSIYKLLAAFSGSCHFK